MKFPYKVQLEASPKGNLPLISPNKITPNENESWIEQSRFCLTIAVLFATTSGELYCLDPQISSDL